MRYTRHLSLFLTALIVSLLTATIATANTVEDETSDYQVRARVARITLLSGDVQLRRAGSSEWERAAVNLPLVEGDQLATGRSSRLEIQIDAHNFVRLDESSILSFVTLRDEGIALSLAEGTMTVRLARFDKEREYFEVDAPKTTIAAEKRGLYRIDAGRRSSGETIDIRVTVRDGGRARIYSETSGFTLRDGRTARLFFDGAEEGGDWELASASSFDEWDRWITEREDSLAQILKYDRRERYYDNGVWGAEELDAYGEWVNTGSYGYVWRPYSRYTRQYNNWAPYRFGFWRWRPPYGWVWIGEEPWGWAPYHYGRWVYYDGYWCWSPRDYYNYGYSRWHPALVVFVNVSYSYGHYVCWYPLPYRHRRPIIYPVTGTGPGSGPGGPVVVRKPIGGDKNKDVLVEKGKRPGSGDDAYLTAVTSIAADEFGLKTKGKAATGTLAQAALDSDAININSVPVKKPRSGVETPVLPKGNDNNPVIGRPRVRGGDGGATLFDRPTGAGTRQPGKPLDDELRNKRVYNGREPRVKQEADGSGVTIKGDTDTGVVARPSRPVSRPATDDRPVIIRGSDDDNSTGVRPSRPSRDNSSSSQDNDGQVVRPPRRPPARPDVETPTVSEPRPQRPPRPERDNTVVRPEPERPRPEPERPRPEPERPRPEPPRPEPPRPEPPRQAPPKSEPPPQVAPPPSNNDGSGGRKGGG